MNASLKRNEVYKEEGKYSCPECGKKFTSSTGLQNHKQLHTGQFRFYCQKCRKGYNTKQAYKVHMDKHQGIKYQCGSCSKSFSSQQMRDYHTSVHTGIYRLTCDQCGSGFNEKQQYNKHILATRLMKELLHRPKSSIVMPQFTKFTPIFESILPDLQTFIMFILKDWVFFC